MRTKHFVHLPCTCKSIYYIKLEYFIGISTTEKNRISSSEKSL